MTFVRILLAATALLMASAAQAQTFEFSKVTCAEFVKFDQATIANLMMWLGGYYMGDDDDPIIDFDKLRKQGEALGKYCAANPSAKLSDAAEEAMGK